MFLERDCLVPALSSVLLLIPTQGLIPRINGCHPANLPIPHFYFNERQREMNAWGIASPNSASKLSFSRYLVCSFQLSSMSKSFVSQVAESSPRISVGRPRGQYSTESQSNNLTGKYLCIVFLVSSKLQGPARLGENLAICTGCHI